MRQVPAPGSSRNAQAGLGANGAAGGDRRTQHLSVGGERKLSVGLRTYPAIWDAYADLALELTREGRGRIYQADLISAVLATNLPADPEAARAILAEYREVLDADPPGDYRAL